MNPIIILIIQFLHLYGEFGVCVLQAVVCLDEQPMLGGQLSVQGLQKAHRARIFVDGEVSGVV